MRVGSVVWTTAQGLGNLAFDFYKHGVITDVLMMEHKSRDNRFDLYPNGIKLVGKPFHRDRRVVEWLKNIDVMLFFETPFDWEFPTFCNSLGVKTAIMTMYEWMPKNPPCWFDLTLCPSLLDHRYYPTGTYIPVPVPDEIPYVERTTSKRFLVNGGNLGFNNGRGTKELLASLRYVRRDIPITIRAQDGTELRKKLRQYPFVERLPNVKIEVGTKPYLELWDGYDVLIASERYNGLSLPLQEARAAGMFVLTTDRFPTNTWLPMSKYINIPVRDVSLGSVGGTYNDIEISEIDPASIADSIHQVYGQDISEYSRSSIAWRESMSWDVLKPKYIEALQGVLR
jgi:hypothetical protein